MPRRFTLRSLRSGSVGIALPRQDGLPSGSVLGAPSLAHSLTDHSGMHELRQQLYHAGCHSEVARLTDAEVLDEVTRLFQTGELRIDEGKVEVKKKGGGSIAPAEAEAPPVAAPPPRQAAAPVPEAADPDTLPPNLDAATQAATLQAAAAQGAPFCPT
jgi:hypothetical protein